MSKINILTDFDLEVCNSLTGWPKEYLITFINDKYIPVLTKEDTSIMPEIIKKVANNFKISDLCQFTYLAVVEQDTKKAKKFKEKFTKMLQKQKDEEIKIQFGDRNIYKDYIEKEILKQSENKEHVKSFAKIFNPTGLEYDDIKNVYLKYSNKTRYEIEGYPSRQSEKEHYDYIVQLSSSQKVAIENYMRSSIIINTILRFSYDNNLFKRDLDDYIKQISDLRKSIKNAPTLNEDIITYRGDRYANLEVGSTVTFSTFISTSTSLEIAQDFSGGDKCCILEFRIPRWANIALLMYTYPTGQHIRELEVLLINGTQWEVMNSGYSGKQKIHRLRFKNANLYEAIFSKTCLSNLKNFPEKIIDTFDFYIKCKKDPTNRSCVFFETGIKIGKLINSRDSLLDTCEKLFNKREIIIQNSNWTNLSHTSCLTSNQINDYLLGKKLGSGSVGEVYKACKCKNNSCSFNSCVAIKKTDLFDNDIDFIENIYSTKALTYQSWGEVVANELVTLLIIQNICPNYVAMNHWFTCENKLYIVNEVATYGDMNKWISKPRSRIEKLASAFQIIAGIYAMQKAFGMVHSDLEFHNILVTNVNKEQRMTYWEYIIGGESYYIPNLGHQFLLSDFGRAYIPGKLEIKYQIQVKDWYNFNLKSLNLQKDQLLFLDYIRVFREFKDSSFKLNSSNVNIENVLEIFQEFKIKPKNYEVLSKYDLDTKIVLPEHLEKFYNRIL